MFYCSLSPKSQLALSRQYTICQLLAKFAARKLIELHFNLDIHSLDLVNIKNIDPPIIVLDNQATNLPGELIFIARFVTHIRTSRRTSIDKLSGK
jgi:hypothetical protein